jgi:ABC-type oligopeptide transport system substrate-binding subunit
MDGFDDAATSFVNIYNNLGLAGTAVYTYLAYDMVWSAAISVAAAAAAKVNTEAEGTRVTGDDVMRVFETGSFRPFNGSTGLRDYLTNGDWNLNHTFVVVTNYGTPPDASEPRHAIVANVSLDDYSVTMVAEEAIVWSNGEQYPYVSYL